MNRFLRMVLSVLAVVLPLGACSSPGSDLPMLPATPGSSSYRLGPGDQLDIKVLCAEEMKGPYTV
jgi:protein involved in polysaccharide export with SLBB domain